MATNQAGPTGPGLAQGATSAEDGGVDTVDNACNTGTGSDTKHGNTGEGTISSTADDLGKGEVDKQNIGCHSDMGFEDETIVGKTDGYEEIGVPSKNKDELGAMAKDATKDVYKKEIEARGVEDATAGSRPDKEIDESKMGVDVILKPVHAKDQSTKNIHSDSNENCTDETEKKIDGKLDHKNANKPQMKTALQSEIREDRTTQIETQNAEEVPEPSDTATKGKENNVNLQDNYILVEDGSVRNVDNTCNTGTGSDTKHGNTGEGTIPSTADDVGKGEVDKQNIGCHSDKCSEDETQAGKMDGNEENGVPFKDKAELRAEEKDATKEAYKKEIETRGVEDASAGSSLDKETAESKIEVDGVATQGCAKDQKSENIYTDSKDNCTDETEKKIDVNDGEMTLDHNNGNKPEMKTDVQSKIREGRTTNRETGKAKDVHEPSDSAAKENNGNLQINLISVEKPSSSPDNQKNVDLNAEKREENETEVQQGNIHPGNRNSEVDTKGEIENPVVDGSKDAKKKNPPGDDLKNKEASKSKALHDQDSVNGKFEEKRGSEESVSSQDHENFDTGNPQVSTSDQMKVKNGKISSNSESNTVNKKRTLEDTMAGDSLNVEKTTKNTGDVVTSQDYTREVSTEGVSSESVEEFGGKLDEKTGENDMDDGEKTPLDHNNGSKPDIAVQSDGREDRTTENDSERTEATSSLKPLDSVTNGKENSENLQDNLNVNGESFASPEIKEKVENKDPKLTSTNDTEKAGDKNQAKKEVSNHSDRDQELDIRNDSHDMAASFSGYKTVAKDKDSTEKDVPEDSNKNKVDDKGLENADVGTGRLQDKEEKSEEIYNDDQGQGIKELDSTNHQVSSAELIKEENGKRRQKTTAENISTTVKRLAEKEKNNITENSQENSVVVGNSTEAPETLDEDIENAGNRELLERKSSAESGTPGEISEKPSEKIVEVRSDASYTAEKKISFKIHKQELEGKIIGQESTGNKNNKDNTDEDDSKSPYFPVFDQRNIENTLELLVQNSFDTSVHEDDTHAAKKDAIENQNGEELNTKGRGKEVTCGGAEGTLSSGNVSENERNKRIENLDTFISPVFPEDPNRGTTEMESPTLQAIALDGHNLICSNESNDEGGRKNVSEESVNQSRRGEDKYTDSPQKQMFSATASSSMPSRSGQQTILREHEESTTRSENVKWYSEKDPMQSVSKYSMVQTRSTGENEDQESSDDERQNQNERIREVHSDTKHKESKYMMDQQLRSKEGESEILRNVCSSDIQIQVQSSARVNEYEDQIDLLLNEIVSDETVDENREEWKKNSKSKLLNLFNRVIKEVTEGTSGLNSEYQEVSHIGIDNDQIGGREENVGTAITSQPQPTPGVPGSLGPQNYSQRQLGTEVTLSKENAVPAKNVSWTTSHLQKTKHEEAKTKGALSEMNISFADEDVQGASANPTQTSATPSERKKQHFKKLAEICVTVSKSTEDVKNLELAIDEKDCCFLNYMMERQGPRNTLIHKLKNKGLIVNSFEMKPDEIIGINIQTKLKDKDVETEFRLALHELSRANSMKIYVEEMKDEESLHLFHEKCQNHFPKVLALQDGKHPLKLYLVGKESEVCVVEEKNVTPVKVVTPPEKKEPQKMSRELDAIEADIFECFQIAEKLRKANPEVQIILDDHNHIHVESMKGDCESLLAYCMKEIDAIFQNREILHEFSDEEILFLKKREVVEFVKSKVQKKHMLYINDCDGNLEITLFCEKKDERSSILKTVKQSIDCVDALLVEDIFLFSDETFIKTLRDMFGDKFDFLSNRNMMVTSDIKKNLMKHLETCMNNMIKTITIDVPREEIGIFFRKYHLEHLEKHHRVKVQESNGKWIVKGKIGAPEAFATDFNRKIGLLKTCKHNLNEFQFENVTKSIVVEIEGKYECSILMKEKNVSEKVERETSNQEIPERCWKIQDGFTVSIVQQHVENVLCGLIVKVGSKNIVPQEMIGEKFACKLHAIGKGRMETQMDVPYWKDGQRKECDIVQNFAKNILEMKGIDKVSFPLNLKSSCAMPQNKFIKSVLHAFTDLREQNQLPKIQQVVFCQPYPKDYKEAVKILSDKMESLKAVQIPTAVLFKSRNKRLKVEIVKGNIAKSTCDIIVNTTSKDLDLQNGVVSSNILNAAGESLQKECYRKYPDGILYGGVAVTEGHGLHCKYILHGALQASSKDTLKTFEKFLVKCMEEACNVSAKSIAFPALGTGNLKYPRKWVAETMFNTVYTFWSTKKNCSVELVEFCLYEKDTETLKAFENEELKWQWPQLEEENSHDESREGRFLLLCTSESESENKKAVDHILEKIGGARSKTSQANDKTELPPKRRAPQPPGKQEDQSHFEKNNGKNSIGPEKKSDKNRSQRDQLLIENEGDYESKRLVVRIKDPNLVQGGEDAVKTAFQRQILEEKKVQHIVYPFNSAEHLLVVCLCKEDADCILKKTVEKEMAFKIQKFIAEAVVNVEAKMTSQVVGVLTSRGYKLSDIAKHSGVTVKENNILFGSLQEIKAAQHFLIQICKNQPKSLENKNFERQKSTCEKSPNESRNLDKDSVKNGDENLVEKYEPKPEQRKEIPELEEEEINADNETWPEFECKKWEFHALNYLLPKIVESSSMFEKDGKIFIQGSKETISELDEQFLKIRKMKRKELSQEDAVHLEKQHGIPWMEPKTKGMLLKEGENAFLLCFGIRELKELEKILEIEMAQVPRPVDPEIKSKSYSISDQQKNLVMDLGTGIKVFVYTAMLDDVRTQSIVLESEKQVSDVTSYSSYMFEKIGRKAASECKKSGRKLKETEAFLSSADELKNCTTIIHFVNPKKENNVDNMRQGIIAAVQNCLLKAEEAGLSSIAFPPICTGLCSLKICSQCYVDAVMHYPNTSKNLMEVHFVDPNTDIVNEIKQAFEDQVIALASLRERQPSMPQESGMCKILIYTGDILKAKVEAICCCEYLDRTTTTHSKLSQSIHEYHRKQKINYNIFSKKKTITIGDTVIMKLHNSFDVIHLWMPITQSATSVMGDMKKNYFKQYGYCIQQMLQAADEFGYPSLACTFFGAGMHAKNDAVLKSCAKTMIDSIQIFLPKLKRLKEIHIVQRNEKQCEILREYLFPEEIV